MKKKRILIMYFRNDIMEVIHSNQSMFARAVEELQAEGRVVVDTGVDFGDVRFAKFDDGSEVFMRKMSNSVRGMRVTHLFLHQTLIDNTPAGFVHNVFAKMVLPEGEYEQYEAFGSPATRTQVYEGANGGLKLKPYVGG